MDLAHLFRCRLSTAIGQGRYDVWFAEQVSFQVIDNALPKLAELPPPATQPQPTKQARPTSSSNDPSLATAKPSHTAERVLEVQSPDAFVLKRVQHQFHRVIQSVAASFEPPLLPTYVERDDAVGDDAHHVDAQRDQPERDQAERDDADKNSLDGNLTTCREMSPAVATQTGKFSAGPERQTAGAETGDCVSATFHAAPARPHRQTIAEPKLADATLARGPNSSTEVASVADAAPVVKPSPTSAARQSNRKRPTDFVFCERNRLAQVTFEQIQKQPGSMTPAVFCGPTGSGKTVLLKMVQRVFRQQTKGGRQVMLTAEQFTASYLGALNGDGLAMFRRHFRDLDLLIVDDIQFFEGKKATTNEFHHTVDSLVAAGKQIVLACDRRPQDLDFLCSELIARLLGGLHCQLEYAGQSARLKILQTMCAQRGFSFTDSVLQLVAERLPQDGRRMSGALNLLHMASAGDVSRMTASKAENILSDLLDTQEFRYTLRDIEKAVCDVSGITVPEIRSASRTKRVVGARMLAMWLSRKWTRAALSEIGDHFGGRSHSTVISATRKIEQLQSENGKLDCHGRSRKLSDLVEELKRRMGAA